TEAISMLQKKLDLHPVKNTSLIEIKAKSDKPEEAARIANAVAAAYKDHRLAQWRERSQSGVRLLEDRYKDQEERIREAQAKVVKLGAELGIQNSIANASASKTDTKEPEPPKQSRPPTPAAE